MSVVTESVELEIRSKMLKNLFFFSKLKSTYRNGRFLLLKKIVKYLSDDVLCYSHIK